MPPPVTIFRLDPDQVRELTRIIVKEFKAMTQAFDDLQSEVHNVSDVVQSAVVLISGIADRVAAAGVDPVALQSLTDELHASADALAASVAANTPAEVAPADPVDPAAP